MINKFKKMIRYAINTLSILIVCISVVLMISVLFTTRGQIPEVMGYSLLRVLTGSMDPTLQVDSLILIQYQDAGQLQPGDVISFYSADPDLAGMVNTHRITRIEQQDGREVYYTQGDANTLEDEYPTNTEDLIGKVVWSSVFLGKVIRLVSNPLVFVPIIIAPLVWILIHHLVQVVRTTKAISREQEAAYAKELEKLLEKKKQAQEEWTPGEKTDETDEVQTSDAVKQAALRNAKTKVKVKE